MIILSFAIHRKHYAKDFANTYICIIIIALLWQYIKDHLNMNGLGLFCLEIDLLL